MNLSLRYRIFGIPANLDELKDKAKRKNSQISIKMSYDSGFSPDGAHGGRTAEIKATTGFLSTVEIIRAYPQRADFQTIIPQAKYSNAR
jgi:hypothetical protein